MRTGRSVSIVVASIFLLAANETPAGGAPLPPAAEPEDVLANFRSNVVVCLDTVTQATCEIWLGNVWKENDMRYVVVWDRGARPVAPTINTEFRLEGREGQLTVGAGKICLKPELTPGKNYISDADQELFAGSGCYELQPHAVGDHWTQTDAKGRLVQFWLLAGR